MIYSHWHLNPLVFGLASPSVEVFGTPGTRLLNRLLWSRGFTGDSMRLPCSIGMIRSPQGLHSSCCWTSEPRSPEDREDSVMLSTITDFLYDYMDAIYIHIWFGNCHVSHSKKSNMDDVETCWNMFPTTPWFAHTKKQHIQTIWYNYHQRMNENTGYTQWFWLGFRVSI